MTGDKPVLTVTQLNTYARAILEQDMVLRSVFVAGEISNFTNHYRSGHFYMSLKDESSLIKAVMFRTAASRLAFMPENGMRVLCRGRVSLYERDGQYQLYVEDMQPDGAGALAVAFEQLKKKLASIGLFDAGHKKALPRYPQKIAVITSPTGAAVRDILNVLSRRYPLAEVVLCPVQVQGDGAAAQLAEMVRKVGAQNAADVIIIARGGGSAEDLWAFNDENLARTIYACPIPVISGVGHETDFTICDFVADLRAPTPSAAAELAVPDIAELGLALERTADLLKDGLLSSLDACADRISALRHSPYMKNPERILESRELRYDRLYDHLRSAQKLYVQKTGGHFDRIRSKLLAFSPLEVLKRGYAIAESAGRVVGSVSQLSPGTEMTVRFSDGQAACRIEELRKDAEYAFGKE